MNAAGYFNRQEDLEPESGKRFQIRGPYLLFTLYILNGALLLVKIVVFLYIEKFKGS